LFLVPLVTKHSLSNNIGKHHIDEFKGGMKVLEKTKVFWL
jgi:hypothetical protein